MSFSLQNLARASVSLMEPLTTVFNSVLINGHAPGTIAVAKPGCFSEWMYYGVAYDNDGIINGDRFPTMLAANYFNNASGQLQVGDVIYAYSAYDLAYLTLQVTSITSGVVSVFPLAGSVGWDATLTAANLLGMNAAPIQILPACPGYAYYIRNWKIAKQVGTLAFANGGAINLYYDNTRTTAAATAIPATVLTTSAAAGIGAAGPLAAFGVASALYVNTAVYLSNATAAFITGDSTATLFVDFDMVPVL